VTGWLRRGPRGVIGTNKVDGEEVAGHILTDLSAVPASRRVPATSDLADLLAGRGVDVVDWGHWQAVAAWERRAGSRLHRRALKAATTADMLHHARLRPASGGAVA
jgi:ferredoxin--NADP+ reductase